MKARSQTCMDSICHRHSNIQSNAWLSLTCTCGIWSYDACSRYAKTIILAWRESLKLGSIPRSGQWDQSTSTWVTTRGVDVQSGVSSLPSWGCTQAMVSWFLEWRICDEPIWGSRSVGKLIIKKNSVDLDFFLISGGQNKKKMGPYFFFPIRGFSITSVALPFKESTDHCLSDLLTYSHMRRGQGSNTLNYTHTHGSCLHWVCAFSKQSTRWPPNLNVRKWNGNKLCRIFQGLPITNSSKIDYILLFATQMSWPVPKRKGHK